MKSQGDTRSRALTKRNKLSRGNKMTYRPGSIYVIKYLKAFLKPDELAAAIAIMAWQCGRPPETNGSLGLSESGWASNAEYGEK